MSGKVRALLFADAIINLALGFLLLFLPAGIQDYFGLPPAGDFFYSSLLGGVIFGIGIALGLELLGQFRPFRGLSLGGAIAINLCGGGVLLYWLIFMDLNTSRAGLITLWVIAILVLGIGLIELISGAWRAFDH